MFYLVFQLTIRFLLKLTHFKTIIYILNFFITRHKINLYSVQIIRLNKKKTVKNSKKQ
jgi:hypothetical protein